MQKLAKKLSLVMVALFTVFTLLSYVPASAAVATPKLQMVSQPAAEYKVGDRITFTVTSPNYGGKVEYRVICYNGTTKTTTNLWNTPATGYYYKGWQPAGSYVFPITWVVTENMKPGAYSLTVLVRRVGAKVAYDSHIDTKGFWVKDSAAVESIAPVADVNVNEGETAVLPTEVTLNMSDKTTKTAKVTWGTVDTTKVGTAVVEGTVAETTLKAKVNVVVKAIPLAVKEVTAINSKQIKVVFTQPVDETAAETAANYYLNNVQVVGTFALRSDAKTLIITLGTALTYNATNVYTVEPIRSEASALVLTTKYSTVQKFADTVAPTVTAATSETNGAYATSVTLTYSEPLTSGIVKIDGVGRAVATGVTSETINGLTLDSTKLHTIEYVNLTDETPGSYANVTAYGSLTFNVTKDATAPVVSSVAPYGDKQVLVTFSKEMNAATVVAGNAAAADMALGNVPVSDISALATDATGTQFIATLGGSFYSSTVTSKTVSIAFNANMRDSLGNALVPVTKSVTLTKDAVAPVVTDIVTTKDILGRTTAIVVKYSEALTAVPAGVASSGLTIIDNNGVLITVSGLAASSNAIAANAKQVTFAFSAPAVMNTKWTVTVPAGLVTDTAETPNASTGYSKLVDMSQPASASTFVLAAGSATILNNVITVNFAEVVKGGAVAGSATEPSNYSINGNILPAGTIITLNNGVAPDPNPARTVATITLPAGFIAANDNNAIFRIANVQNANSVVMTPYLKTLVVADNVKPVLNAATLNADNSISVGFSEAVVGLAKTDLVVKVNGSTVTLTPAAITLTQGAGSDAGKWVLSLDALVLNNGTVTYLDMDNSGTYLAGTDILLATETTETYNLKTSTLITSVTVGIIPTGTPTGADAATNRVTNGTTLTVK